MLNKGKWLNGRKSLTLEAAVVPEVCSIQINAHLELARKEYPHLKGIWFLDVCKGEEELEIDILIGSDYLWNFKAGSKRRGKAEVPVAVETELGWVLSGPLRMATTRCLCILAWVLPAYNTEFFLC